MGNLSFRPVVVDENKQELTEHGTIAFPMSIDRQMVSKGAYRIIPHWHYEIQIALIITGTVCFRTPAGDALLHAGEGIFINSGVLHEVFPADLNDGIYISVNFSPSIIYGQSNSIIQNNYVSPIMHNPALQIVPLRSEPWQIEVCDKLRMLSSIYEAQDYGYELETKAILCRIWQLICVNCKTQISNVSKGMIGDWQRMKGLEAYIQKSYMNRITLADIADAAHISRGECCRFFKRVLHTTPMNYLTDYRLQQSIKLLTCTDMSVAQIALQTGFSSSSYYAECFRSKTGQTPLKYRKQFQSSETSPAE